MKILLTGATGYIGKRILPVLVDAGHEVICCVRDKSRFKPPEAVKQKIKIIQIDLLVKESLDAIPRDIDGGSRTKKYEETLNQGSLDKWFVSM